MSKKPGPPAVRTLIQTLCLQAILGDENGKNVLLLSLQKEKTPKEFEEKNI